MALAEIFQIESLVRVTASFAEEGTPFDPDTVTIRVRNPLGSVTEYLYGTSPEVVREAGGIYHLDIETTASGDWRYRWKASGPGTRKSTQPGLFVVADDKVG